MDETPKSKAEIWRKLDQQALPLLREAVEGSASPDQLAYQYDAERWDILMEWLKRHAGIMVLRGLKAAEPPADSTEHEAWQFHYDKFKERFTGFIKMHDSGVISDPEAVFFVVTILMRMREFSQKTMDYLKVKPRPHLGELERPPETEVVLGDPDAP